MEMKPNVIIIFLSSVEQNVKANRSRGRSITSLIKKSIPQRLTYNTRNKKKFLYSILLIIEILQISKNYNFEANY